MEARKLDDEAISLMAEAIENMRKTAELMGRELPRYDVVCKFCGSVKVVKNGSRKGTQYWLCRNCGRGFVANKSLPKMKYPIEAIASALYTYYCGSSLNQIRGHIDQHYNVRPSDSAIYGWVTEFTKLLIDEAKKYTPKVGDDWLCDETMIDIFGKKYWVIDCIDNDTRFLLASRISPTRNRKDIALMLNDAKLRADKSPKRIITDGWLAYPDAVDLVFGADTRHKVSTPFVEVDSTNIVERYQGSLKDRTKVMRGFKKLPSARLILDGWVTFYNYFRPHISLAEKTPAEVAGIRLVHRNWLDVVKSQTPLALKTEILPRESRAIHRFKVKRRNIIRRSKKEKSRTMVGLATIKR